MIRITAHPKDAHFLLLKVPQDLNAQMGTFGPAQLAVDLRGYVMPADKLDSLVSWAKFHGVDMLNEVRTPGERTRPLECGNEVDGERCCKPLSASFIPAYCGGCGLPPTPVHFEDSEPIVGRKCPACSKVCQGGPKFCIHCGAKMPKPERRPNPIKRAHLPDPITLGQAISETKELSA